MRAKIISVVANNFYVHLYDLKIQIKAIPKGIFKHNSHELKPMVGDDVEVELIGNTYLITKIYERYNQLIRPKVANIDIVLIVVSIVQPDLNTLSLNKYLAFYEARNIKNVLIGLSKYDLANNHLKQKINKLILDYKKNNYAVFILTKENDILLLKEKIKSKTLCLAGNSGVGKSTLINKLRSKHSTTYTGNITFSESRKTHNNKYQTN